MVRGVYIARAASEQMTLKAALTRYLAEVSPTKKISTAKAEKQKAGRLINSLGEYSLAALSPDLIAQYRDDRLSEGKSNNTVRLELALLSHLWVANS